MFHTIPEAIHALKKGEIIIVVDDEERENEGDLVALSQSVTPETINFMITHGRGLVCATITEAIAEQINLPLMTDQFTDPDEAAFTVSVDHVDTETGTSAPDRAKTIQALSNPQSREQDFKKPGHVFPLIAKKGGVFTRPGHTEASVDLALLSGATPSSVICEVIKDDGTMARVPDLVEMADSFNLTIVSIEDLIAFRENN